ncbi:MAG: hypothetical protein EOO02_22815 [Chitinophagaceae bacterium]|nr:MAG: hypothetical protein EOO02_22815 [Chitinophagaceae bacterium]
MQKNIPDSIAEIWVGGLVLDKKGKIIFFEVQVTDTGDRFQTVTDDASSLGIIIGNIISKSPAWRPGCKGNAPVYTFVAEGGTIVLKPITKKQPEVEIAR